MLLNLYCLFSFLLLSIFVRFSLGCRGCVELDEFTFDKVLTKFSVSIVKFDIAFPYGDKHEAYASFAKATVDTADNFLVAIVGIKDYGEKDNANLAKRFNISEKSLPAIKLFFGNIDTWDYPNDLDVTVENLKKFTKEKGNIYIGLSGCIRELDILAERFVQELSSSEKANEVLSESERYQDSLIDRKRETGKIYISIMKRIIEKGIDFVNQENERIMNLLTQKLNDDKKRLFHQRINILQSFRPSKKDNIHQKTDL